MNKEILNKIDKLREGQLYAVLREDNQVASVTPYKENLPTMMMEEYCGVKIKLTNIEYNKQPMDWTIQCEIEDEDGYVMDYEFTISIIAFYN
jgi:hypothetical protein